MPRIVFVVMELPTYKDEPDVEVTPNLPLDKTWSSIGQIRGCPHDPPCKLPLWYRALVVLGVVLFGAAYLRGYEAHFHMVPVSLAAFSLWSEASIGLFSTGAASSCF